VALAYAGITRQMRHDIPELKETVRELRELSGSAASCDTPTA